MNTIGNFAPDFELPGIDQTVYHLRKYRRQYKAIAVVFMDNDSAEVERYIERLRQIQADFGKRNFTIMGINSTHRPEAIADTIEGMKRYAQEKNLNFPYLRDTTQDVAKSFKVKFMPTVYLLDSDAVIRYQGIIDDCAESVEKANNHYLRDSIAAMLSGGKIPKDYVQPTGDPIKWRDL